MRANYDYNFGDYNDLPAVNINEPHCLVLILADCSGSMKGLAIENLMKSINRFKADVCSDPKAAKRLDVAVLGFNHDTNVVQGWRPITQMEPVHFVADGGTNLNKALLEGVEMLRSRGHYYEDQDIELRLPMMVLISDGYGGDISEAAALIKQRTADKKMQLWALGAKGYDKETMAKLTDGKRVFELVDEDGYDFHEFFQVIAEVSKKRSTSAPGEKIKIDSTAGQVDKGSNCRVPNFDEWLNE